MKKSVVHAVFNCSECPRSWDNFLTAKKLAKAHSENTGHRVTGEEGIAFDFGPELGSTSKTRKA